MTPTKDWQVYDHSYEKEMQDIRTRDGKEYVGCWPNAGEWHILDSNQQAIPDHEVTHIRQTQSTIF